MTVAGGLSATQFDDVTTVVGVTVTGLLVAVLLVVDIRVLRGRRAGVALTVTSIRLGLALLGIGLLRFDRLAVN